MVPAPQRLGQFSCAAGTSATAASAATTPTPTTTTVFAQDASEHADCPDLPSLECSTCAQVCTIGGFEFMVAEHGPPPWTLALCTCCGVLQVNDDCTNTNTNC